MADNDREVQDEKNSQAVTSVHPEEPPADLRVKGGALCECGVGFDEATQQLLPGNAHKHPACLYCGVKPGGRHDWTKPHPRMVWRQAADRG